MKEILLFLPIAVVYLAVKTALFPSFPLPDIPLLMVFYLGYTRPSTAVALFAFAVGFIDDAFSGGIVGATSFALVAIFIAVYVFSRFVQFTTPSLIAGGGLATAILKGLLTFSVLKFSNLGVHFFTHVLLQGFVTAVFAPLVIAVFSRITSYINPQTFKDSES